MKIFGDKSDLAIEYSITRKIDNYTFANLRFWINNEPIGDFENEVVLENSIWRLKEFLNLEKERYYPTSENKTKEDIFNALHGSFISDSNKTLKHNKVKEDYLMDSKIRNIFHLEGIGDSSFIDKIEAILLNENNKQRLIWKDLASQKITEKYLPAGYFEITSNDFLKQVELDL